MMVLTANRIANAIVQRLRLRSTSEPPPSEPWPEPTPKAPERPASFPECMSTRKISTTLMMTCTTLRIVSSIAPQRLVVVGAERIQATEQLDGLRAQLAVDGLPVVLRQLAGAVVHLGLADLAVARLLGGLEVLQARRVGGVLRLAPPTAQRVGDRVPGPARGRKDQHHGHHVHRLRARRRGGSARPGSRATRAAEPAVARRCAKSGVGQMQMMPPRKAMIPPNQIHITIGETMRRNVAG